MPIRIQRVVSPAAAVAAAALGVVILAFLYTTSPAMSDATFVTRLTAGERWRPFAAIVGTMGLVWGASSLVAGRFQRRQLAETDEVARRMGMERIVEPAALLEPGLELPILQRTMTAVIRGRHEGTDVLIGCYTVGGEHAYGTAVACFRLPRPLPVFALAPEGLSDKVSSLFGAADIDFETHPAFSSAYRLRSSDEPATRVVFSDTRLLDRLAADKGWYAECGGSWLALYRPTEAVPRAALPQFLQRATPVFQSFLGR
jgi:hypothetical protein